MYRLLIISLCLFSASSYANVSDNLRWTIDASARLNNNISADNTSRIYALGLDTHKVFTRDTGDIGYAVAQVYFTKLSNHLPVPWMFDSKDDGEYVIREAHVNYTALPTWAPNIRLGHFTLPFGLEESIDTNGRLLDYYHGKNLGTKLDWGVGLNKVHGAVQYNISYTLGGKDKAKSIDGSYVYSGRIGSLSHLDFIIGLSLLNGKVDKVKRQRLAIDWQYYWGTWGLLGEVAIGKENKQSKHWQKEKYSLIELNKTFINEELKVYSQFVFTDKTDEKSNRKLLNIGLSYQFNTQLELSMSTNQQLNTPSTGKKQHLARFQFRYRY